MRSLWVILLLFSSLLVVRLHAFTEDDSASDLDTEMSNEEEEEEEKEDESGSGATEIKGEENERIRRTNEESTFGGSGSNLVNKIQADEVSTKRTEIKNGQKAKGLTSNTEVSVPAGVIAKVFGSNGNTSASLIKTPDLQTVTLLQNKTEEFEGSGANAVKRTEKPKPIGPMETLEITLKGEAATKNNFTKNNKDDTITEDEISNKKVSSVQKKSETTNKEKTMMHHIKNYVKSHLRNKKSKVAYPKIILYQGPLSKAIEKMLYGKATTEEKRSQIEKLIHKIKSDKKSKVQKKRNETSYKLKGFVDNVKVEAIRKSPTETTKNKTVNAGKKSNNKSPVLSSDKQMREHLNDFMKEVSASGRSVSEKNKKKTKGSGFVATKLPKLRVQSKDGDDEDDEEGASASGEDDEEKKKTKDDKKEDDDEDDSDGDGEDDSDEESKGDDKKEKDSNDENDSDDGSTSGINEHNANEPKPAEPVQETATTEPETNPPISPSPSPSPSLITPTEGAAADLPAPVQNIPPGESPAAPLEAEDANAELPPALGQQQQALSSKPTSSEDATFLQDDMMTQLDMNSESIETLISRVSSLETKEKELESAMGSISEGLERIEKKLDSQQHPSQSFGPSNKFNPFQLTGVRRPVKLLKEIFIPLPPRGSDAAREIEQGKLMNSPVLNRLPLPIRQIVSNLFKQRLKKEDEAVGAPSLPMVPPSASLEPDEPAKEHDIDKLEVELGRVPISRHGIFSNLRRAPKLLFFAKTPRFFELMSKPCESSCHNGHCLGNNVCRCFRGYTGPQCQHKIRPTIVEIIGPALPFINKFGSGNIFEAGHHGNNKITLPFVPTNENSDDENESEDESTNQRTLGHVEQSKLVDILKKFAMPFSSRRLTSDDEGERDEKIITMPFKRYNIPRHYSNNNNPYYEAYNRNYKRGYNNYYNRYF